MHVVVEYNIFSRPDFLLEEILSITCFFRSASTVVKPSWTSGPPYLFDSVYRFASTSAACSTPWPVAQCWQSAYLCQVARARFLQYYVLYLTLVIVVHCIRYVHRILISFFLSETSESEESRLLDEWNGLVSDVCVHFISVICLVLIVQSLNVVNSMLHYRRNSAIKDWKDKISLDRRGESKSFLQLLIFVFLSLVQ